MSTRIRMMAAGVLLTFPRVMKSIISAAILMSMLGIGMQKFILELPENNGSTSTSSRSNITHASTSVSNEEDSTNMQFMDTRGVELYESHGDSATCRDVMYTADNRLPTDDASIVNASWGALSFIVNKFPAFNSTCAAYFHISDKSFGNAILHPVWGRLPATSLAMSHFPSARYFLYMDTDAVLANANHNPTQMYDSLVNKQRQDLESFELKSPSLVVNKPTKGWLCKNQCARFGLGHGCFNSGVLLWRRSKGAQLILRAWWESRLDNITLNFHHETESFYGWSGKVPSGEKMSEQNRLMYVYHTNPEVRRRVLPVPRQLGAESNSTSCPEIVDKAHVPCLQNDSAMWNAYWNRSGTSCFVNHYANAKGKVHEVFELILESDEKKMIMKRLYPLIQQTHPNLVGAVAGLLLKSSRSSKLLHLLDSPEALNNTIQDALNWLEDTRNVSATHD